MKNIIVWLLNHNLIGYSILSIETSGTLRTYLIVLHEVFSVRIKRSCKCDCLPFVVVQSLSHVQLLATPWTAARARLLWPPLFPGVCSNSCPLSRWGHLTISSSVTPFSFSLQSFPALGFFPMSQLFASGGQSFGASASAILSMNIQCWFPLGFTALISLPSKGLWRVFSSTTTWKHQFFGTQPSLWSSSHIHTCLLEKP